MSDWTWSMGVEHFLGYQSVYFVSQLPTPSDQPVAGFMAYVGHRRLAWLCVNGACHEKVCGVL